MNSKLKLIQSNSKSEKASNGNNCKSSISKYFQTNTKTSKKNKSEKLVLLNKVSSEDINEFGDREPCLNLNDTSDIKLKKDNRKVPKKLNCASNVKNKKRNTKKLDKKQPRIKDLSRKSFTFENKLINNSLVGVDLNAENFQLAIALSISTSECNENQPIQNTQERMCTIKQTLEQFGFKTNKTLINQKKPTKPSNFILVRRDPEKKKELIENNIDNILRVKKCNRAKFNQSLPFSIFSDMLKQHVNNDCLYKESSDVIISKYISQLIFIEKAESVSLLKDWNCIPGRHCDLDKLKVNTNQKDHIVLLNESNNYQKTLEKRSVIRTPVKLRTGKNLIFDTDVKDKSFESCNVDETNDLQIITPKIIQSKSSLNVLDLPKINFCLSPDLFSDEESYSKSKEFLDDKLENLENCDKLCSSVPTNNSECLSKSSNSVNVVNSSPNSNKSVTSSDSSCNSINIRANGKAVNFTPQGCVVLPNYCLSRFLEDVSITYNTLDKSKYKVSNVSDKSHDTNNSSVDSVDISKLKVCRKSSDIYHKKINNTIYKSKSQKVENKNKALKLTSGLSINNSLELKVVINNEEKSICDEISLFPKQKLKRVIGCHNIFKKNSSGSIIFLKSDKSNTTKDYFHKKSISNILSASKSLLYQKEFSAKRNLVDSNIFNSLVKLKQLNQTDLNSSPKCSLILNNESKIEKTSKENVIESSENNINDSCKLNLGSFDDFLLHGIINKKSSPNFIERNKSECNDNTNVYHSTPVISRNIKKFNLDLHSATNNKSSVEMDKPVFNVCEKAPIITSHQNSFLDDFDKISMNINESNKKEQKSDVHNADENSRNNGVVENETNSFKEVLSNSQITKKYKNVSKCSIVDDLDHLSDDSVLIITDEELDYSINKSENFQYKFNLNHSLCQNNFTQEKEKFSEESLSNREKGNIKYSHDQTNGNSNNLNLSFEFADNNDLQLIQETKHKVLQKPDFDINMISDTESLYNSVHEIENENRKQNSYQYMRQNINSQNVHIKENRIRDYDINLLSDTESLNNSQHATQQENVKLKSFRSTSDTDAHSLLKNKSHEEQQSSDSDINLLSDTESLNNSQPAIKNNFDVKKIACDADDIVEKYLQKIKKFNKSREISDFELNVFSDTGSLNNSKCAVAPDDMDANLLSFEMVNDIVKEREMDDDLHQYNTNYLNKSIRPEEDANENKEITYGKYSLHSPPRMSSPNVSLHEIKKCNVSPKPNFKKLGVRERKNLLIKYGLKDLRKKRADQLLEYIYEQTHPVAEVLSKQQMKSGQLINYIKLNGKDIEIAVDSNTIEPSQNIVQSSSSKISQDKAKLYISFLNILRSDRDLKTKILRYEPIELEFMHAKLKENGHRFDIKFLQTFLDEKNIAFKTKEQFKKTTKIKSSQIKTVKQKAGKKFSASNICK